MAGWMKRLNFWNLSNGANGTQSSELWPQRWQIVIKFHWNERRWWTCLSTCLSHPAHSFGAHYHFRLLRIFSTRSCAIFSFVNSCGRQSHSLGLFEKWNRLKWRHLLNVWGNRPLFIRFLRQMARISKFFQNSFKTKMTSFTLIPKSLVESVSFGDWKAGEMVASSLKVWTEYRSSTNCRSLTKYGYLAKYRSLAKYRCLTKRRLLIKSLTNKNKILN